MSDTRQHLDMTLETLLRRLDVLVDWLDEQGHEDFDLVHADGKLVLAFQDGRRIIINRQSGNDQIWVAEPKGGWHFDLRLGLDGPGDWICDKRGVELFSSIEALLSATYGIPVSLST